ncbi:MAG: hypothetical protein AB1331_08335 [Bacillota bacterium]
MRKAAWIVTIVVLLLILVPLPLAIRNVKRQQAFQRIQQLPDAGYAPAALHERLGVTAEVRIFFPPYSAATSNGLREGWQPVSVSVTIVNLSSDAIANLLAGARLDDSVMDYLAAGAPVLYSFKEVSLIPGELPTGLVISRIMPVKEITDVETLSNLKAALSRPIRVRLVYDGGEDLLTVTPTVSEVQGPQ